MQSINFRTYNESYYETVCSFLIERCENDLTHINWNWSRWEWMMFHPEFNHDLIESIGLWFDKNMMVGMATFDHYYGEACYIAKKGYEHIELELLSYAIKTFSDRDGLGIAVNETDKHTIDLLHSHQFEKHRNIENILECKLDQQNFEYTLPSGITLKSIDPKHDWAEHQRVLWLGFNNEGNMPSDEEGHMLNDEETISKQRRMLTAPHMNSDLHVVAQNEAGEFVAYCGCWYNLNTDYVYIEPVCTIPQYRRKGIAKAVLLEALKRSHILGAEKAYVISDDQFYKSLGFHQHSRYHFYWHTNTSVHLR